MNLPRCLDCGKDYDEFGMDLLLQRSQWLEIHPDDGGLLCANCIVKRASRLSGALSLIGVIEIAVRNESSSAALGRVPPAPAPHPANDPVVERIREAYNAASLDSLVLSLYNDLQIALRPVVVPAPAPQEETIRRCVEHWFIQGGKRQYGDLYGQFAEPQNADELISAILERVRSHAAVAEDALARLTWQPMETMPETGQVIVCWNARPEYDTIGRAEYLECVGLGEPPALGWMPLPPAPDRSLPDEKS